MSSFKPTRVSFIIIIIKLISINNRIKNFHKMYNFYIHPVKVCSIGSETVIDIPCLILHLLF